MNYIKANKEAREEAFSHRKNGWGEDVAENLQSNSDFYINPTIKAVLDMILAYPMRMMAKAFRYPSLLVSEKE